MIFVVVEGRNLLACDSTGKSDPFCEIYFNDSQKTRKVTETKIQTLEPVWNETFQYISEDPKTDTFKIVMYDWDKYSTNDFMGELHIPVYTASKMDGPLDEWFNLLDKGVTSYAKSKKERGEIRIIINYERKRESQDDLSDSSTSRGSMDSHDSVGSLTDSMADLQANLMTHWEINFEELTLTQELGRGAFGIVYRGKWRYQDVAVKLLLNQNMTDKELEEFRAESQLMMNLRPHRNVVPLLGICTTQRLCIITDYIEAGSLERLIRSPYLITWRMVLSISKGIVAGMYHLHQEKILHRDLAARNILLRSNYEPSIADFGLSKKIILQQSKDLKTNEENGFRGPYKWMAPESLSKFEFTIKSDAFSFGVVLWEIISRQEPFPQYDIYEAARAVIGGERLVLPPNCPTKFGQIMQWCWEADPDMRPDFAQISDRLDAIELEVDRY
eukprot:TRINITY_DN3814_c0_g1_i5.p1 TRINITY_DN3814_c0_g1~~TRINITY_DN3814_c0_g1_i5.p1  ORF type:complete len:444 (-),score=96.22 TRINITY_DN3814_c0_g1_i5:82-1413(-)